MCILSIASKPIRELDGLYSLNDLHKTSGGGENNKPSNFIRLKQTQELIEEINRCSDVSTAKIKRSTDMQTAIKTVVGGNGGGGTYACKELVYSYAMWISPKFHLHVIRAFDDLQNKKQAPAMPTVANIATVAPGEVSIPKDYLDLLYVKINNACAAYNDMAADFAKFKDKYYATHDMFLKLNALNEMTQLNPTFKTKV